MSRSASKLRINVTFIAWRLIWRSTNFIGSIEIICVVIVTEPVWMFAIHALKCWNVLQTRGANQNEITCLQSGNSCNNKWRTVRPITFRCFYHAFKLLITTEQKLANGGDMGLKANYRLALQLHETAQFAGFNRNKTANARRQWYSAI